MNKKWIAMGLCLGLVAALSLSGCGTPNGEPEPEPVESTIQDYFPMGDNARYVFEGIGNEYASFEVFNEYASGDKIQQRVDNGGTVTARVLEISDGKLIRTLNKGETYYREDMLAVTDGSEEVLLMEPLVEGTTWTLADGRERTINAIDADVSVPLGSYKAIEVVTTGPDDVITDYYAEGVGLVKTVFTSGDTEVSSSLKTLEKDATRIQLIQFYFPNIDLGIFIKNKEVSFKTNDVTSTILEEAYKAAIVSNVGPVFTENTKINSLFLNADNKVEIDLNAAFKTEMNAGAGYETMILQCLANTFGQYYGVEEVILTIDGAPYASGHIEMQEGESLKVDFENAQEIDV